MAVLKAKARNKLPASNFAGPNRSFPVEDRAHAIAAKRLVGRSIAAGNTTPAEAAKIKAKANKVLNASHKPEAHVRALANKIFGGKGRGR